MSVIDGVGSDFYRGDSEVLDVGCGDGFCCYLCTCYLCDDMEKIYIDFPEE